MRLISVNNETLINPEYISHITVRVEPASENGGKYAHDYPVYRITMADGTWYDIPLINRLFDQNKPFEPIGYWLREIQDNSSFPGYLR